LSSGLQLAFQNICADGGGICGDVGSPVANFSGDPTNGVAPLTVSFTNLSSSASNYNWNFGDGNTSTAASPGNTYTNAGNYTVTLTAVGAGGTNILSRTNYIVATNPPTVADFIAGPTSGIAPLIVSFTNLSGGAASYLWDFGNGATSTVANPTNLYTNAGSYTVSLTAVGVGGTNTLTRTNYIIAIAPAQLITTPASLDFGLIAPGVTTQAMFVVSNAGAATLSGTAAIASGPFTILSGTPFSLSQSNATNLVINFASTNEGVFSNAVLFASTGGALTNAIVGRVASAPTIVFLTLNGSEFMFSFETVFGLAYVVQYKDFLDDPVWKTLQSVTGDGAMKTITNSISGSSQHFYRLKVQ
jgi:PKD repeat protein